MTPPQSHQEFPAVPPWSWDLAGYTRMVDAIARLEVRVEQLQRRIDGLRALSYSILATVGGVLVINLLRVFVGKAAAW